MTMDEKLYYSITNGIAPISLEVINESYKHAGHTGDNGTGETHYSVVVISDKFEGKTRLQCQRMIMDLVKPLMVDGGIHALRVKTSIQ